MVCGAALIAAIGQRPHGAVEWYCRCVNGTIRLDKKRQQWRADVAVNGVRRRKRFPITTSDALIRAWIHSQLPATQTEVGDAAVLWQERWVAYVEGRRLGPPARGISWTIHGWRLQVMKKCRLFVKSFPKSGPMDAMLAWLEAQRSKG